jgi:hypothetical protein
VPPTRIDVEQFALAFPRRVRSHLQPLKQLFAADVAPLGAIKAWVGNDLVSIPYRVYFSPIEGGTRDALTPTQRLLVDCLHTRHYDGVVREQHCRAVAASTEPWIPPFVLQLLGEYVLEVALTVTQAVPATTAARSAYAAFCDANPPFVRLVKARATSYWNCYYRHAYPRLVDYPPRLAIMELCGDRPHSTLRSQGFPPRYESVEGPEGPTPMPTD